MIDSLNRQLNRLERMQEKLYDDKLSGYISKERYEAKCQELEVQAGDIRERLFRLYEIQDEHTRAASRVRSKNPIAFLYMKGSPNEKRIIISNIFKEMLNDGGQVGLYLKF